MSRRAALLALVGAWGISAASARADDFTVSTGGDTGSGSLREAVSEANASSAAADKITFQLPANSTITLASDLAAIKGDLTYAILTNPVIVDGNDAVLFQNESTAHAFSFDTGVTFRDGKIVFTEATTSGTIAGVLKGNDVQLSKAGAGTTTLNASQTITLDSASSVDVDGGTFAVLGTLSGPGTFTIDAPATLVIGSGGSVTAGTVTDEGRINVNTGGTLTPTGSLTVASGGTLLVDGTVNAAGKTITNHGSLVANGALTAGSLVIASDGVLTGTSTSINAPLTVLGRVAPSTSAGTLGITGGATGDVTFGSSSTFEVDMGPSNSGDSLTATGDITISPGARLVIVDPTAIGSAVGATSTKTVLTAGSINGQFVEPNFAFFKETYNRQPTFLEITLERSEQSFLPFAQTPNQGVVAQTLDAASTGPSDDLQTVLDALYSAQADEIPPLLDAIGGESLTAFATARQILGERTARALHRRARDLARGEGRAFYRSQPEAPDVAARFEDEPIEGRRVRAGAWLDALGLFGQLEGDTGEADVDTLLYGGTLGADARIDEHFVIGLAAGYARSDVDLDGREADVFGDTVQTALYAGFVDPRGYVSAYGRYAYTFEDSSRRIESSTLSRRHAHADWGAQDYGAGGEAGITVASLGGFALQPIAGVDWLQLSEESYTEHGAGSLNLIVDPETLESTTARFGGRVFGRLDMGESGILVPELRAFYQHLYGDRERVLEARLSGAPGLSSIGVRGPKLPRDNLILGLGWGVMVSEYLTVSFAYDAVLGSDRVEHQADVAARVLF